MRRLADSDTEPIGAPFGTEMPPEPLRAIELRRKKSPFAVSRIPKPPLDQIRCGAAALPAIVCPPPWSASPAPVFGIALVPVAFVPMKLPATVLPGPVIETAAPAFPEITLRAAAVVPPMVLPAPAIGITPKEVVPLGTAPLPAALVPIKLP